MSNLSAAALSITKLYRSSRKTSKRAYNAGYGAACQDLLNFVQQGVSTSGLGTALTEASNGGMTIGSVMVWTEARLEAIRATEEEEDEDEEKEKEKDGAAPQLPAARNPAVGGAQPAQVKTASRRSVPPRTKDVICSFVSCVI